jgi:hypothetical protein
MKQWTILATLLAVSLSAQTLPNRPDSLKFAIIGDSGTGGREQREVGALMEEVRQRFPFKFVIMLGDNMYGGESPSAFKKKFEDPYRALLDAGVKFYASLGNHDQPTQVNYKLFNMQGKRYYSFKPEDDVRFFALDTTYMDAKQLEWVKKALDDSGSKWKIAFFHHPLYSSGGRHGSDLELRAVLEPLFVEHGVSVVFAGHDHFYERVNPQKGITHFISGGAAKLRRGNIDDDTGLTAKGFDQDRHFMLAEIEGDRMWFEAISRADKVVDSGVIVRRGAEPEPASGAERSSPAARAAGQQ